MKAARVRIDADAEPMERGAVVIEDGRIREIVAQSRLPKEGDARVIDAGSLTVVPGFVDAHLHVTTEGAGRLHEEVDKPADEATAQGERNLANALSWGVTTVRDAGSWNDVVLGLRDRIARGALVAPRVLPCGAPVTTPRGHLWWFGGEAQGLDAVRAVVRRQAQLGMTHVKVMSTGGWATKGSDPRVPQFSGRRVRERTAHPRDQPRRRLGMTDAWTGATGASMMVRVARPASTSRMWGETWKGSSRAGQDRPAPSPRSRSP